MKHFLIGIILFLAVFKLNAQEFFADEQNKDTISKPFYENKNHGTICFTLGIPKYSYGGCFLIHYNKEKFSPFFEMRINPLLSNSYTLVRQKSNTNLHADSTYKQDLTYRLYNISVGIAASPRKNVLIYANVGIRYQQAYYKKTAYSGYYIKPQDNEIGIIYGGGMFYVLPFGLTAQLGADFSKFSILTGLGYTF